MVVLDTHIIVWDALTVSKLSKKAKDAIDVADEKGSLIICDISIWEIAMLIKKNRLQIEETPANLLQTILDARRYVVKGITPEIAERSVNLGDEINNDPADRLIVATAMVENYPLITADKNLRKAKSINTIW